jgi:hypothetical protein
VGDFNSPFALIDIQQQQKNQQRNFWVRSIGINRQFFLFLLFFLHCCDGWGYIVAFTKVLTMYQIYHTWIHPFYSSPLSPPIPGIVSTGINFAFMDMCTHILHHIDPPTYFLYHHPLPLVPAYPYPCEGLVHPPVLKFCRRKKIKDINKKTTHFLLFEIKVFTKGISLWYFHVYMYYHPNWFVSSIFFILT